MNRNTENKHFRFSTEGEAGHPMMVDAACHRQETK